MKANELLEVIKNNDIQFMIMNDQGEIYCNQGTSNIMDIYGITGDDGEHFYGVYGDIVGGQIDSRTSDDEVILNRIEKMLSFGSPTNRKEFFDSKKPFDPTFYWGD